MAKEFEVRFDGLLPADPDQAWAAITTSQTAGWLWEIDYEPRLGARAGPSCATSTAG